MRNERLIIPSVLQKPVLEQIHTSHQGIEKCCDRAKHTVWWPGLLAELKDVVSKCQSCSMNRAQKTEPMIPSPFLKLSWQKVDMDLFEWQKHTYLIIMDYYSRFMEIAKLDKMPTEAVIQRCENIFSRYGIPEEVVTDNGLQFDCNAFCKFSKEYQFRHVTGNPYYLRSNGEAERG